MCRTATIRVFVALGVLTGWYSYAQPTSLSWRHIGNSAIDLDLPSVATGRVDRVWYSADGETLYTKTASGRIFQTNDFERWSRVTDGKIVPPAEDRPVTQTVPEDGIKMTGQATTAGRFYSVGGNAYRSDDDGVTWSNLTKYKGISILGEGLTDVAASPRDSDEVVVASRNGLWRSVDAGASWSGLNEALPNLPSGHLMGTPSGMRGVRLAIAGGRAEIEWAPGERSAWKVVDDSDAQRESALKQGLTQVLKRQITAVAVSKDSIYAGDSDGRLQMSADAGRSWGTPFRLGDLGPVESIWVDANDSRVAIAALSARATPAQNQARPAYVLRTMNGGIFWDDITANLPEKAFAHGVTADRTAGAIYVATEAGVFFTSTDLGLAGRATSWTPIGEGLPQAAASDVRLDAGANQLYVALDGYGVYSTIAPHRLRDVRVVSAADFSSRAAAPGALFSVLGARVDAARTANSVVPVLDANGNASQIQVPFEAKGSSLSLSLDAAAGRITVGLPLQNVAPAIFVDPEGAPLVMDASSGVLLDSSKPAHANAKIQILATGFGRVKPDWPTGLAAPLNDPPRVLASIRGYLDRSPVEVTQATLAPGYVGFYLIEIQLPRILNAGPAELYLESEGQQSNRVRLYIEP